MSPQGPPADPCIPPARQRVRDHRPVRTRPPASKTDKGRPRYRPTGHWCHSVTITVSLKLQPTNGECRTRLPTLLPLNSTQKNSNNQKKIRKQKKKLKTKTFFQTTKKKIASKKKKKKNQRPKKKKKQKKKRHLQSKHEKHPNHFYSIPHKCFA